jgi:hypothetical protein
MFVRFRTTRTRLQVSLAATRRADGTVRHEYVASLGSLPSAFDAFDRLTFWRDLHGRLARLDNRLSGEEMGRVLGQVHARIPMPTQDEQTALQIATAEDEAGRLRTFEQLHAATAAEQAALADKAAAVAHDRRVAAQEAAAAAAAADRRAEAIRRGEAAGAVRRPPTREEIIAELGFTPVEVRFMLDLAALPKDVLEAAQAERRRTVDRLHRAGFRAAVRTVRARSNRG